GRVTVRGGSAGVRRGWAAQEFAHGGVRAWCGEVQAGGTAARAGRGAGRTRAVSVRAGAAAVRTGPAVRARCVGCAGGVDGGAGSSVGSVVARPGREEAPRPGVAAAL